MSRLVKEVAIDLDEDQADSAAAAETVVDEDGPVPADAETDADVVDEDIDPLDRLPPHAKKNQDGSVTLPLKFPRDLQIRKNGKVRTDRYERLVFHRLNGADQRAIAAAKEDDMSVVAFARSTRISQAIMNALFDKMDGADIAAGGQVLNSFFATGRTTGR
ncbi:MULTISPECIES: hypothetical protein [Phyllobacteriaceae]|jgi:hypothetical protein|uniref:Tail assembly chaperone n=1 Tax=Mesorhizobium hungaricum TaxID=1566387 RepID=A0A1C2DEI4_9HYPH|nr:MULTISPECIES: hypothetical protein [Mesorhizobium]MBN9232772.1 hypothetical protein [Mesorhizobium sp.]MDQ0330371.1 hypothetical protein [Mesorhizobium sp. YL-MeA3-2017]OCX13133.1 hypothetical protein QV13_26755 [Mesorhizobium hungaricum]